MANTSIQLGLSFTKNRAYISDISALTADKVVSSLAYRDFSKAINNNVLLNNDASTQDELISGLAEFIKESSSPKLSFVIDNSLINSCIIPYSDSLTDDETADLVDKEFSLIIGEKKSFYIYEWAPIKGNKLILFWIPEIVIARLQLIVSRMGKNLTIVDLEPLSIINLVTEKQLFPNDGNVNVIIKWDEDYFAITGYEKSDLVFYEIYYKTSPADCPFYLTKLLGFYGINLQQVQNIYWYGKELQQSSNNIQSILNKPVQSLFESLKIIFHRHSESGNLPLDSAVSSLSVALRTET